MASIRKNIRVTVAPPPRTQRIINLRTDSDLFRHNTATECFSLLLWETSGNESIFLLNLTVKAHFSYNKMLYYQSFAPTQRLQNDLISFTLKTLQTHLQGLVLEQQSFTNFGKSFNTLLKCLGLSNMMCFLHDINAFTSLSSYSKF